MIATRRRLLATGLSALLLTIAGTAQAQVARAVVPQNGGVAPRAAVPGDSYSPRLRIFYRLVPYGGGFAAVLTRDATADSPMSQIALERGDMITHLDNMPILNANELENHGNQTSVTLINIRTNRQQTNWVNLPNFNVPVPGVPPGIPGVPPGIPGVPPAPMSLGVTANQVSVSTGVQYDAFGRPISATRLALQLVTVTPGGAADRAGLRVGDIVLSAGAIATGNINDLRTAVANSGGVMPVTFLDGASTTRTTTAYMGAAAAAPGAPAAAAAAPAAAAAYVPAPAGQPVYQRP